MHKKLLYSLCGTFVAMVGVCLVMLHGNAFTPAQMNAIDSLSAHNPHVAIAQIDSLMQLDSARMSRHEMMKLRLMRERARNSARVPLCSTQEAKGLVDYFDSHGTDKERMSAYYTLGSVYEQKDSLMDALKCYNRAIEYADTLSPKCDYRTLAIIYGVRADILEDNFLLDNAIASWKKAYGYSLKANDKYLSINIFSNMSDAYFLMGSTNKAIENSRMACDLFAKNGYEEMAKYWSGIMAFYCFEEDSIALATQYATKYMDCKLLFDDKGRLKDNYDIYHYIKGRMYLADGKMDSAKVAFEALSNNKSCNFKQASFKGLYMLYKKKCITDSIVKYAELWNAYADSSYREASMSQLNKVQYAYGYSQKEKDMLTVKAKFQKTMYGLLFTCCIFIMLIMAFYIIVRNKNIRIRLANEKINTLNALIEQKETRMKTLLDRDSDRECNMENYKDEIRYLKTEINGLKDEVIILQSKNENSTNIVNDILTLVTAKAKKGMELSPKEKKCFVAYARKQNPHLAAIIDEHDNISEKEILACCLVVYNFVPSEIICLMGISSQSLSNLRSRLNVKMFGLDGGAKDFDKNLRKFIDIV